MPSRTIKTPSGEEITISSDELEPEDLAVAEVLIEMAAEQGTSSVEVDFDEAIRRLAAKGYGAGGELLH